MTKVQEGKVGDARGAVESAPTSAALRRRLAGVVQRRECRLGSVCPAPEDAGLAVLRASGARGMGSGCESGGTRPVRRIVGRGFVEARTEQRWVPCGLG